METYQILIFVGVLIFIFFIFRNKKSAQREINGLNEIDYNSSSRMKFDDVAGNYEAKENLIEIVDFLKNTGILKNTGA